jgi:hypothetical protein
MWLRCDVCRRYARLKLAGLHDVDYRTKTLFLPLIATMPRAHTSQTDIGPPLMGIRHEASRRLGSIACSARSDILAEVRRLPH